MSDVRAMNENSVTAELVLSRIGSMRPKSAVVLAILETGQPVIQWSSMPLEQVTWLQSILDMAVKEQLSRIMVRQDPR